jgi:hypothetical protein
MLVPFMSHYFPNSGYIYLKIPFDVIAHRTIHCYTCAQEACITCIKSHLTYNRHIFVFVSDNSEEDSGWLFAGKEKGSFVTISVLQVTCVCLFHLLMYYLGAIYSSRSLFWCPPEHYDGLSSV